jgi:hypothetical protein
MFFIEKHILSIARHEKFSTKKNLEEFDAFYADFDIFGTFGVALRLEHFKFLE